MTVSFKMMIIWKVLLSTWFSPTFLQQPVAVFGPTISLEYAQYFHSVIVCNDVWTHTHRRRQKGSCQGNLKPVPSEAKRRKDQCRLSGAVNSVEYESNQSQYWWFYRPSCQWLLVWGRQESNRCGAMVAGSQQHSDLMVTVWLGSSTKIMVVVKGNQC